MVASSVFFALSETCFVVRPTKFALETDALRQLEPQGQPAFSLALAVVIVDAPDPGAAKDGVVGFGEDERVFDGNAGLIVISIEHQPAELLPVELALVHHPMHHVSIVVAGGAFAA